MGTRLGWVVAQACYRLTADQVPLNDLFGVIWCQGGVPDALRINHGHRSVAALAEAAGVVDADLSGQPASLHRGLERAVNTDAVTVDRRAPLSGGADEDMALKDGHRESGTYPCGPTESTGSGDGTPTLLSGQEPRRPHLIGAAMGRVKRMIANEVGRLLTASEVAEMLHLHVNTVKRLGDRGELPFFRVCKRGDRRFRYDDVLDFLRRAK